MRSIRVFHPGPLKGKQQAVLDGGAVKHLLTVLRLKPGSELMLFDGSGFEYPAVIEQAGKKEALVKITGMHGPVVESPLKVTLAQGVSRGERMDYTVQKAVELGVADIHPVLMERSVVKLDNANGEKKRQHWRGVVISACEQSGRVRVPEMHAPLTFPAFLDAQRGAGLKLLLDPLAPKAVKDYSAPADARVLLLVGPEGGLSGNERKLALKAGFQGIKLGPRILRTETAALVALSLLQSAWGDLG